MPTQFTGKVGKIITFWSQISCECCLLQIIEIGLFSTEFFKK